MVNPDRNLLICPKCGHEEKTASLSNPVPPEPKPFRSEEEDDFTYGSTPGLSLKNTAENSAEVGRRLLAGWTMLAESCPQCLIPLMRKSGETECVGCGTKETKNSQKTKGSNPSQATTTTPQPLLSKIKVPEAPKAPSGSSEGEIEAVVKRVLALRLKEIETNSALSNQDKLLLIAESLKIVNLQSIPKGW